ncbi:cytoplasmic peptidoglycan synthetase domain protein [Emticicia oligotrophica DSM 17448]|uniref:Cytoplasmic peptidoglycan synthetase domain protein n=1 Tax=Emticicia oligotrophica (strain DSM 17448 / CIP 109782 / MTCC 6937 / GPTSA100-15) TaxID=929562 RepID=A0ABM5N315_EMTOG|nr:MULTISPECIES: Mur ligase domain-containing protein [Emticicia]AFK03752.1 cytoplasmic peptidoglycan synthetase domain protein [Emticicia oligotrophica DSM 17448]
MSKKIHFIAIGGAVMHNLALALHKKGYQVTGSDDEINDPSKSRLAAVGILPAELGWFPEKITADLDAVILGMHAFADNPELAKAQELGLKIYSFPEYIYEQSQNKQRVVIAGSHGKTSITSIILHVLKYYNRKFDYLVGAQIEGFDVMVQLSDDAPVIIIEGDEYPESKIHLKSKFLFYHPHICLLSGIAWDHFNIFTTFDSYVHTFEELADGLPKAGSIVYDETDDIVKVIGEKDRLDVSKFPYKAHPYKVENGKCILLTKEGEVALQIFGEHNMKNLNGAKIILDRLGITDEEFYQAIQHFSGASKRLEKLGENANTLIYRDFAHAPSKLEATTKATKSLFPNRRLVACYELHTFSSLNKDFLPQYEGKMDSADTAIVFYTPHTLEMRRLPMITPDDIKKSFGDDNLMVFTDAQQLKDFLMSQNWFQTNLLMMSSGTFGGIDLAQLGQGILAKEVIEEFPKVKVISEPKEDNSWSGLLSTFKKVFEG